MIRPNCLAGDTVSLKVDKRWIEILGKDVLLLADKFVILLSGEVSGRYAEMAQPKNFFK